MVRTRGGALVTASLATACGLGVVGVAPLGDGDAGPASEAGADATSGTSSTSGTSGTSGADGSPLGDAADGAKDAGADAPRNGGWCTTQPAHRLCFDFDDGTLGPLEIEDEGSASCAVANKAFGCTTPSKSSTAYAFLKQWAPKPKTIDLAFDVSNPSGGYAQLGGITTGSPYYEMLITPNGGSLSYIEYASNLSFARTISPQGTGLHRVRIQVDFTTNHVTVSEGGVVRYDAKLQASLANATSAQALVGIYDTDRERSMTIDNVTLDWTE